MSTARVVGPLHTKSVGTAGPHVAFLHGLFGQGRNWNQITKGVTGPERTDARCLLVDLPDHGRSPRSEQFSYEGYADSVAATLSQTAPDETWTLVGHSLGGKVAMLTTLLHPDLVERLVVVDIAPKDYGDLARFEGYINEMLRLPLQELHSRAEAEERFHESDPGVKAFLLQNLRRDGASWHWQANLDLFAADAAQGRQSQIAGFPSVAGEALPFAGPVLWIAGGESAYVKAEDAEGMRHLFPAVRQLTVKGASHWVHTDAPDIVIGALRRFVGADA
ncbi:MAG: alpha/beta fold hydrolase [Intrasporangium sp.]|uniref:alpha/beta fold hydrolase n=1 Tax=Intrasporangium sp. TaxID=1925024 RepID=UPI0026484691|nr:alpha/beta fold hydrolase [Intrasporangium sp.]MDN5797728.1 alpha/beta fold hydrolase [Intrasporangium sp.]